MIDTDATYGYNTGCTLQSLRSLSMSTICFIYTLKLFLTKNYEKKMDSFYIAPISAINIRVSIFLLKLVVACSKLESSCEDFCGRHSLVGTVFIHLFVYIFKYFNSVLFSLNLSIILTFCSFYHVALMRHLLMSLRIMIIVAFRRYDKVAVK